MKKVILLSIILIFLTGCGGLYDLNNFILPDDIGFLALIEELDTPRKIVDYMGKNFTYERHIFYTPDPYVLWKTKKGDCNDFSTFAVFIANYHGYGGYQIKLQGNGLNIHWLAVYLESGQYSYSNNTHYYYVQLNEFRYIVMDWHYKNRLNWISYIVYDYNMNIVETGYNN